MTIQPRQKTGWEEKEKTTSTEDKIMKNSTPKFAVVALALSIFLFTAATAEAGGKKNFHLSIGHGGSYFGYGHGHHGHHGHVDIHVPAPVCHTPVYNGGYVWVPGYYVGHGDHAHYIPGRYVWQGGYYPY